MQETIIKVQTIGFFNPTRVECQKRILETQQMSIYDLIDLWKWYFNIPPYNKIVLEMDSKNYSSIMQKTLSTEKSVYDIFHSYGIECREIKGEKI